MFVYYCIHMTTTTVRLESKLKNELESFRNFGKESYSDIIKRLINIAKDDETLEAEEINQIERSLADIKRGRVLSLKDAEKKWGI